MSKCRYNLSKDCNNNINCLSCMLNKIKTEIEQAFLDDGAMQEYTVEECLQIIDKYREEITNTVENEDKWINIAQDLIPIIDKAEREG